MKDVWPQVNIDDLIICIDWYVLRRHRTRMNRANDKETDRVTNWLWLA